MDSTESLASRPRGDTGDACAYVFDGVTRPLSPVPDGRAGTTIAARLNAGTLELFIDGCQSPAWQRTTIPDVT